MDVADNETEGSTILYQAEDKGKYRGYSAPAWINRFNRSEFRYRSVSGSVTNGYWWNEVSWPFNTITDGNAVRTPPFGAVFASIKLPRHARDQHKKR